MSTSNTLPNQYKTIIAVYVTQTCTGQILMFHSSFSSRLWNENKTFWGYFKEHKCLCHVRHEIHMLAIQRASHNRFQPIRSNRGPIDFTNMICIHYTYSDRDHCESYRSKIAKSYTKLRNKLSTTNTLYIYGGDLTPLNPSKVHFVSDFLPIKTAIYLILAFLIADRLTETDILEEQDLLDSYFPLHLHRLVTTYIKERKILNSAKRHRQNYFKSETFFLSTTICLP